MLVSEDATVYPLQFMSPTLSHREVLSAADPAQGHSKGTKRGSEALWSRSLLIQTPSWTSPPVGSLLTFFLLHADGGVGEDSGVSLQGVVVRAIVLLVLE